MGAWRITVEGHGQNHNKQDTRDADEMGRRFVLALREAGQDVKRAIFEYLGTDPEPL